MSGERLYSMKEAERRTGLSAHLLRMWERRYNAVTPSRPDSRQRMYTGGEIERLQLLAHLTRSGMTIGRIARLSLEELQALQTPIPGVTANRPLPGPGTAAHLIGKAMSAVQHFDTAALYKILDTGMVTLGYSGLLETLLIPLLQNIGTSWETGELTTSQEHAATAALKDYLARHLPAGQPPPTAPRLLVTTPAGQHHEMGAVIAAGLARKAGWNVTFLGASLPAEEIAGAARTLQCQAIALSPVYPMDDPHLPGQLIRLRELTPGEVLIIAGGRAVPGYRRALQKIGAHILDQMSTFTPLLRELREALPPREVSPGEDAAGEAGTSRESDFPGDPGSRPLAV